MSVGATNAAQDPLKEKRVELILQQLEDLPTLPAIALKVLQATGSDEAGAKEVTRLIESDQALTAKILQLVKRADSGVRAEVATVERAVVLLGFEAVRSATLAVTMFQQFPTNGGGGGSGAIFSRDAFWKHAVAVACASELLAEEAVKTWGRDLKLDPAEAFTCGLLHDLGKVALDAVLPKSFAKVVEATELLRGNIADVERSVIGIDHMTVGKRLAERWKLPTTIRDVAWLHGQLPTALPSSVSNTRLVNIVSLADILARQQHIGYSGNHVYPVPVQTLAGALGLSNQQIEMVSSKLVGRIEPRAKALGLSDSSTGELYQEALAQANKELGRVSTQLAQRNRKLVVRAKYFETLSKFHGEMQPDAPPAAILVAIGQTAIELLKAKNVGVFSLAPDQTVAELTVVDEEGNAIDTLLAECNSRPGRATTDALARPVGPELEPVLTLISPRLTQAKRFWISLEADGQCVGGVVWGGADDEMDRLAHQMAELAAVVSGWAMALRTGQIRDEARNLTETLAEANRSLQNAQSEVLRGKTMSAVGEMAAGAAHEMNNPLMVISGRSQQLAASLTDAKQRQMAALVYEQSQKLSDMITELMHYSCPPAPVAADVALQSLIAAAQREVAQRFEGQAINWQMQVENVPPLRVDAGQVVPALVELLDNAVRAGEVNGVVNIHAGFNAYSNQVVLTVQDSGTGMEPATLRRAFDPFFSHKPAGRRRGMGLSKALRWVENNGGTIRLDSQPGLGTRAMVLLPAAMGNVGAVRAAV